MEPREERPGAAREQRAPLAIDLLLEAPSERLFPLRRDALQLLGGERDRRPRRRCKRKGTLVDLMWPYSCEKNPQKNTKPPNCLRLLI